MYYIKNRIESVYLILIFQTVYLVFVLTNDANTVLGQPPAPCSASGFCYFIASQHNSKSEHINTKSSNNIC